MPLESVGDFVVTILKCKDASVKCSCYKSLKPLEHSKKLVENISIKNIAKNGS